MYTSYLFLCFSWKIGVFPIKKWSQLCFNSLCRIYYYLKKGNFRKLIFLLPNIYIKLLSNIEAFWFLMENFFSFRPSNRTDCQIFGIEFYKVSYVLYFCVIYIFFSIIKIDTYVEIEIIYIDLLLLEKL